MNINGSIIVIEDDIEDQIIFKEAYLQLNFNNEIKFLDYKTYRDLFENKPINPDDWRTVVFNDPQKKLFIDATTGKIKNTKVTIVEPNKNKHETKWFKQNNIRK